MMLLTRSRGIAQAFKLGLRASTLRSSPCCSSQGIMQDARQVVQLHSGKRIPQWRLCSTTVAQDNKKKEDGQPEKGGEGFGDEAGKQTEETIPAETIVIDPEEVKEKKFLDEVIKLVVPADGHEHSKLVSWLVEEGVKVKSNDSICEIETPDYIYDFQANESGFLAKKMAHNGQDISPGTVLGYIGKTEDDVRNIVEFLEEEEKKKNMENAEIPPEEPSNEIVVNFLKGLESDMSRYAVAFEEEGFDTLAAISTITKEDLTSMNVKKGHIRVILKGIETLNEEKEKENPADQSESKSNNEK